MKGLTISKGRLEVFPRINKYSIELNESNWNHTTHTKGTRSSCGWDELTSLNLFDNLLTTVPSVGFLQFQLLNLRLSFNRISLLSNMCNINYTVLKYLYLNDNKIIHVNLACLIMPKLENVFLNRNFLQFIGDVSMTTLGEYLKPGYHTVIELSINPIHCGLNLSWILEALHEDNYIQGDYFYQRQTDTPKLLDMQQMQCYTPGHLKGRFVINLGTQAQYICHFTDCILHDDFNLTDVACSLAK